MTEQSLTYKKKLASDEQVTARIEELATEVITRYKDQKPLFVCLLRGGAPFASRLMFAIARQDPHFQLELDYMTIKTYSDKLVGKQSELIMDLSPSTKVDGRHVVLLDDVLDKGLTAQFAHDYLTTKHAAATVDYIVLVQKNRKRAVYQNATLYGFEAPEDWLTGMGMDDSRITKEANRWADFVAIAN